MNVFAVLLRPLNGSAEFDEVLDTPKFVLADSFMEVLELVHEKFSSEDIGIQSVGYLGSEVFYAKN